MDDELMEWAQQATEALEMADLPAVEMDSDGTITVTAEDGVTKWVGTLTRVEN